MDTQLVKMGFPPVYNEQSKLLILGSFPSVKSREISFYYGNKQNRFWRTVCGYFREEIPESVEGKRRFCYVERLRFGIWQPLAKSRVLPMRP